MLVGRWRETGAFQSEEKWGQRKNSEEIDCKNKSNDGGKAKVYYKEGLNGLTYNEGTILRGATAVGCKVLHGRKQVQEGTSIVYNMHLTSKAGSISPWNWHGFYILDEEIKIFKTNVSLTWFVKPPKGEHVVEQQESIK